MTYDETSIRVLSADEAAERFMFANVEKLAKQYPHVSTVFLGRLVEACQLSGWDLGNATRRYCAGDKTI